ncbi:MAG TPA: hypothetical protein VN653_12425 [Anaerolineales bacterium]|nr:hypothetical protein [Anaerolineales bacterium]
MLKRYEISVPAFAMELVGAVMSCMIKPPNNTISIQPSMDKRPK